MSNTKAVLLWVIICFWVVDLPNFRNAKGKKKERKEERKKKEGGRN